MELLTITILISGGFMAGIINTFAGNGSAITLGMLTELVGLPANIANGTNRIGVLVQSFSSFIGLQQNNKIDLTSNRQYIFIVVFGAVIGATTSTMISNEHFTVVYKVMMVVLLVTIFFKPKRWITPSANHKNTSKWIAMPVLFAVGFYGGFIQMGMGLIFLGVMVLLLRHNLLYSNALKVLVVSIFSIAVLAIFVYRGMVEWVPGLTIALGQGLGGWIAGKYIARSEKVNQISYFILVVVMIAVVIKMFAQ